MQPTFVEALLSGITGFPNSFLIFLVAIHAVYQVVTPMRRYPIWKYPAIHLMGILDSITSLQGVQQFEHTLPRFSMWSKSGIFGK